MKYISLFSGIGGLEDGVIPPILACDIDPVCRQVLSRRLATRVHDDVRTLLPPEADVVVGGFPCQDLSVAGKQAGLDGERSGLFDELLRVARGAGAHTVVAENVPNLLAMKGGGEFTRLVRGFAESGFHHVAWRTLNAREFGLPHQRRRAIIVASKHPWKALSLHRNLPKFETFDTLSAAGFYWTAGGHSICYSRGYVPTLKVGSSLSIPSPPAVFYDGVARKLLPGEALRLQGFVPAEFDGINASDIYRMAGNAVAVPMGHFAVASAYVDAPPNCTIEPSSSVHVHGYCEDGVYHAAYAHEGGLATALATNLRDFLDLASGDRLSQRAASGLLRRLGRSGKDIPDPLRATLEALAR